MVYAEICDIIQRILKSNEKILCNEFCLDFMEPYDYFGLNKEELIELIQHFCYWLNAKQYTKLQLGLINMK